MNFSGDILPHSTILARAKSNAGGNGYSFTDMFKAVAPIIRSADLAVCHQETVIAGPDNQGVQGYPSFIAPHQLAAAERNAGWDACDTASNHTADHGLDGIKTTIAALDSAGIRHTGSYASADSAQHLTVYDVHGVLVGHIAVTYGLNNGAPPTPWSVNRINIKAVQAQAHRLKQRGVDIVIVSVHDGIEQDQAPSADQRSVDAKIMQSKDIDLIIGAHAHVVQPIKRLADGRYIVYGVGNFLAMQSWTADADAPPSRDGIMVIPTFTRGSDGRYRITEMGYVPTFVRYDDDCIELAPSYSQARTKQVVNSLGAPVKDITARFSHS